MDRLRSSPPYLPLRTLLVCGAFSLYLLGHSGGSIGDGFEFLIGMLPVGLNAESLIMVLVQRAVPTFALITLALVLGLSLALAVAMLISSAGARFSKSVGWVGRALVGVPPMFWAWGSIYLIVHQWELPVETLFPYNPPAEMEPLLVRWGRALWAWMVPAVVLSTPVFGMALFSFTHRLGVLLKDPMLGPLKSRGLSRAAIKYHHLVPELRIHLMRLARPCAAMLLACAIPVELIFQFGGWGSFAADAVRLQHPLQLAASLYLAGIMMAAWYAVFDLGDNRSLPPAMEHVEDEEQTQSRVCFIAGAALALALLVTPYWAVDASPWRMAWLLTLGEAGLCLVGSLLAALVVMGSSFLAASIRRPQQFRQTGLAATLATAPLLLLWMMLASLPGYEKLGLPVMLGLSALPGVVAFHASCRDASALLLAQASRSLGRNRWGAWWDHAFLNALPSLLNWLLRNAATLLVWKGIYDYLCAFRENTADPASSWGGLMARSSPRLLDDPISLAAPAILMALWGLAFRLLSRAFRTDTPPARISPFAS